MSQEPRYDQLKEGLKLLIDHMINYSWEGSGVNHNAREAMSALHKMGLDSIIDEVREERRPQRNYEMFLKTTLEMFLKTTLDQFEANAKKRGKEDGY